MKSTRPHHRSSDPRSTCRRHSPSRGPRTMLMNRASRPDAGGIQPGGRASRSARSSTIPLRPLLANSLWVRRSESPEHNPFDHAVSSARSARAGMRRRTQLEHQPLGTDDRDAFEHSHLIGAQSEDFVDTVGEFDPRTRERPRAGDIDRAQIEAGQTPPCSRCAVRQHGTGPGVEDRAHQRAPLRPRRPCALQDAWTVHDPVATGDAMAQRGAGQAGGARVGSSHEAELRAASSVELLVGVHGHASVTKGCRTDGSCS